MRGIPAIPSSISPGPASKPPIERHDDTQEPSDEELIRRFRRGDASAFEALVARWSPVLLRLAWRLTGDSEEARDVRQMALLRTYNALGGFNGRAQLSTWLFRVVLNLCRDRRRGSARLRQALGRLARDRAVREEPAPESRLERGEDARRIAAAVAGLPEAEREVLVLRHYEGLGFAGIAEVQGAPVPTVKSRMAKGLERLRVRLKDLQP